MANTKPRGRSALTMLREDHRNVQKLFREFKRAKEDSEKQRIVETACVVLPKTRTSWRDQTTSYMSPAAPDRMKIARMSRGWRIAGEFPTRTAYANAAADGRRTERIET